MLVVEDACGSWQHQAWQQVAWLVEQGWVQVACVDRTRRHREHEDRCEEEVWRLAMVVGMDAAVDVCDGLEREVLVDFARIPLAGA